jgi:MFS family permease
MELMPDVGVTALEPGRLAAPSLLASPKPLRNTLGLITLAWMFGSVWFTTTTGEPLTLFAQKLGASNFEFGLLTALPFLASLMAVPGSLLIEWTGRRKRVFVWSLYVQRAMWFAIAMVPMWIISRSGTLTGGAALTVFLWLMLIMHAAGALGGPAWLGWMADVVPSRLKGKYFSRRRQWGILTAVPAALFVGWFLDHRVPDNSMAILRWCAIFFLASAVCGLMDIQLFQHVPAAPRPPKRGRDVLQALKAPFGNRQFVLYSAFAGVLTFAVTFLGQFATLYLLEKVGVANMGVQMVLVVTPMVAQLLVLGAWGRAADRMGKRPLLILASAGLVPVGVAWCFVTPSTLWLGYLLSGLGAALWTGVEVANMNLVLEHSAPAGANSGGSSFAAINSVIINIAGCAGGLAAGVIAQVLGNWHWQLHPGSKTFSFYDVLFALSGLLRLLGAVAFIPLLCEPSAQSAWHTGRYILNGLLPRRVAAAIRRRRSQPAVDPKPLRLPATTPQAISSTTGTSPAVADRRQAA